MEERQKKRHIWFSPFWFFSWKCSKKEWAWLSHKLQWVSEEMTSVHLLQKLWTTLNTKGLTNNNSGKVRNLLFREQNIMNIMYCCFCCFYWGSFFQKNAMHCNYSLVQHCVQGQRGENVAEQTWRSRNSQLVVQANHEQLPWILPCWLCWKQSPLGLRQSEANSCHYI